MSPITVINKRLAKLGRVERIVRGRGYYYLRGGDAARFAESGFYGFTFPLKNADTMWPSVLRMFAENGIDLPQENR